MKTIHKRLLFWIPGAIIGVIIILAVWLYSGSLTDSKISVFAAVHAPLAYIDGELVTAGQLRQKIALSAELDQPIKLSQREAFNAIIRDARTKAVADKYDVDLPKEAIELAYSQAVYDSKMSNDDFSKHLQDQYHLSSKQFKDQVLEPLYWEFFLRSWYAQNQALQKDNVATMEMLQTKIQNGENFEDLAKIYSKDEATKSFGGSLGFISDQKLLPELAYQLASATKDSSVVKDANVIAGSRLGLHLIQVNEVSRDSDHATYNARQIFLPSNGFDEWLNREQGKLREYTFTSVK